MPDTEDTSPPRDDSFAGSEARRPVPQVHVDADLPQLDAQPDAPATETADASEPTPSNAGDASNDMSDGGSELAYIDASSLEAVPRRAGSPVDSLASGPGGSPSIQVGLPPAPSSPPLGARELTMPGLFRVIPRQQRASITGLAGLPQQSVAVFPAL